MNQPKYLLDGKPYTPAAHTNIRETFDKIRRELKEKMQPILIPESFVLSAEWFQIED